jgi:hypothetical protein
MVPKAGFEPELKFIKCICLKEYINVKKQVGQPWGKFAILFVF